MEPDGILISNHPLPMPKPKHSLMSEFKELGLEINDLSDESAEDHLKSILQNMNGVHTARITQSGVHIIYNPLGITSEEIVQTVRQAGYTIDLSQKG